jgi:hypothetical protein
MDFILKLSLGRRGVKLRRQQQRQQGASRQLHRCVALCLDFAQVMMTPEDLQKASKNEDTPHLLFERTEE